MFLVSNTFCIALFVLAEIYIQRNEIIAERYIN